MSTILKALRRLEADKRAEGNASLDESIVEPVAPVRGAGRPVLIIACIAAILGVGAIGYSLSAFLSSTSREVASAVAANPALAAAPTPSPVMPAPAAFALAARPSVASRTPSLPPSESKPESYSRPQSRAQSKPQWKPRAKTVEDAKPARSIAVDPPPVAAAVPDTPATEPKPTQYQVAQHRPPSSPREPQSEPAEVVGEQDLEDTAPARTPLAMALAREQAETTAAASTPAPLGTLEEQPASEASTPAVEPVAPPEAPEPKAVETVSRTSSPVLRVVKTIWHPLPARRVAVVEVDGEPHRAGQGDFVAGYRIDEIGLSEVDLSRDGVTLRKRVGAD